MVQPIRDISPLPGRETHVGLLLAMLDDTTVEWRNELGRIGSDRVRWQPAEEAHSIGAVILHIADVEAFWLHEIAAGCPIPEPDVKLFLSRETQQYRGVWPKPPRKPLAWFYAQHDRIRARTHELLATMDDPEKLSFRGERPFTLRWLIYHVITHEAYHAGQAVLLASLFKGQLEARNALRLTKRYLRSKCE